MVAIAMLVARDMAGRLINLERKMVSNMAGVTGTI